MLLVLCAAILLIGLPARAEVELASFNAIAGINQVTLQWVTTSETNNDHFDVYRYGLLVASINGTNSSTGSEYEWIDTQVEGWNAYSYSLYSVDLDGIVDPLGEASAYPYGEDPWVELFSFSVEADNEQQRMIIIWQTAIEWNIDRFELEREPSDVAIIYSVEAQADSGEIETYQFMDTSVVPFVQYDYDLYVVFNDVWRLLLFSVSNQITTPNSALLINLTNPLLSVCDTGLPLPDGTVIELWHDADSAGLDEEDQIAAAGYLNGLEWNVPGGFQIAFDLPGLLPLDPYFRLCCCVPGNDRVWYSEILTFQPGEQTIHVGSLMYCVVDSNETCSRSIPPIQVNLVWDSPQSLDLDIYVTDPTGEICYFGNSMTSTGGQLIRDNLCSNYENGRPEIIIWTTDPPLGEYIVEADWWSSCGNDIDSQEIEVRASVNGRMMVAQMTMEEGGSVEAMRFNVDTLESSNPEPPKAIIPEQIILHQNYPNPFNPSTTISFEMPKTTNITLTAYDVLGREVVRLVDGSMTAGTHSVNWECSSCATGVYLIELKSDGFREVKKAMLLR